LSIAGTQAQPEIAVVESIGATYVSGQSTSLEQLAALVGNIDVVYEATVCGDRVVSVMESLEQRRVSCSPASPDAKRQLSWTPT